MIQGPSVEARVVAARVGLICSTAFEFRADVRTLVAGRS